MPGRRGLLKAAAIDDANASGPDGRRFRAASASPRSIPIYGGAMLINRIQVRIFRQLCEQRRMDSDEYVRAYSEHYLGKLVVRLENLTEEDGDLWITRAYLQSL